MVTKAKKDILSIKPNSILCEDIYNGETLLLTKGTALTENLLLSLQKRGIKHITVIEKSEQAVLIANKPLATNGKSLKTLSLLEVPLNYPTKVTLYVFKVLEHNHYVISIPSLNWSCIIESNQEVNLSSLPNEFNYPKAKRILVTSIMDSIKVMENNMKNIHVT